MKVVVVVGGGYSVNDGVSVPDNLVSVPKIPAD